MEEEDKSEKKDRKNWNYKVGKVYLWMAYFPKQNGEDMGSH